MNRLGKISLVIFALSVCATAALLSHAHQAQRESVNPREIYEIVAKQFDSFQQANYIQAYDHAARAIQGRFNLSEFEAMMRAHYPVLTKASRMEFGSLHMTRNGAHVKVYFIEKNGFATACLYSLVPEQGQWKIDGVEILRDWPRGSRLTGLRI